LLLLLASPQWFLPSSIQHPAAVSLLTTVSGVFGRLSILLIRHRLGGTGDNVDSQRKPWATADGKELDKRLKIPNDCVLMPSIILASRLCCASEPAELWNAPGGLRTGVWLLSPLFPPWLPEEQKRQTETERERNRREREGKHVVISFLVSRVYVFIYFVRSANAKLALDTLSSRFLGLVLVLVRMRGPLVECHRVGYGFWVALK